MNTKILLTVIYLPQQKMLENRSSFGKKNHDFFRGRPMRKTQKSDRPRLTLVRGGRISETKVGTLRIAAAPKDAPPFPVEAIVFEEDTFLVMSADPTPKDRKVPLVKIMTNLIESQPRMPGTVVLQGQSPLRVLAIIHDFNQDPSWKEEWIESALMRVFVQIRKLGIQSLALPFLGTVYGTLDKRRFIELLVRALRGAGHSSLRFLWLVVPAGESSEVIRHLKAELERQNEELFSPLSS